MRILLEQEHEDLLSTFVEAYRNVSRDQRHPFSVQRSDETSFANVHHPGLPVSGISAYEGDLETLAHKGLFRPSAYGLTGEFHSFDLTPEAFECYREIKQRVINH